jgi:hypothetical protein
MAKRSQVLGVPTLRILGVVDGNAVPATGPFVEDKKVVAMEMHWLCLLLA